MHARSTHLSKTLRRPFVALAAGLAAVAVVLVPVHFLAHGEALSHARLHLVASSVAMIVSVAVALTWRRPRRRSEAGSRRLLISTLAFFAAAQVTEAVGALAWRADGETVRWQAVEVVHTVATVASGCAVISVAVAAGLAVISLTVRLAGAMFGGASARTLVQQSAGT
jgi:peptidoglycan/LPS O-acetylase OafA/YrhL